MDESPKCWISSLLSYTFFCPFVADGRLAGPAFAPPSWKENDPAVCSLGGRRRRRHHYFPRPMCFTYIRVDDRRDRFFFFSIKKSLVFFFRIKPKYSERTSEGNTNKWLKKCCVPFFSHVPSHGSLQHRRGIHPLFFPLFSSFLSAFFTFISHRIPELGISLIL